MTIPDDELFDGGGMLTDRGWRIMEVHVSRREMDIYRQRQARRSDLTTEEKAVYDIWQSDIDIARSKQDKLLRESEARRAEAIAAEKRQWTDQHGDMGRDGWMEKELGRGMPTAAVNDIAAYRRADH